MPGQFVGDYRLVEAVIGQRLAHPSRGRIEPRLRKSRSGRQPAGRLQLRIDRRALGSVNTDGSYEFPRRTTEDNPHAVVDPRGIHLNRAEQTRSQTARAGCSLHFRDAVELQPPAARCPASGCSLSVGTPSKAILRTGSPCHCAIGSGSTSAATEPAEPRETIVLPFDRSSGIPAEPERTACDQQLPATVRARKRQARQHSPLEFRAELPCRRCLTHSISQNLSV